MTKDIEQSEFENLKKEIGTLKLDVSHEATVKINDLLDYCYELDKNALPPVYSLKQLHTLFKDEVWKNLRIFYQLSFKIILTNRMN